MDIVVYLHDSKYMEATLKTLEMLKKCKISFTFKTFRTDDMDEISEVLGQKIRRYPQVVIDGERIGGYYDLVEYLLNKDIINYLGDPRNGNYTTEVAAAGLGKD